MATTRIYNRYNNPPPSPYFDIASQRVPSDIKSILSICRYYILGDDILHPIVRKLAEYPVTEIIFTLPNELSTTEYEDIFEDKLDITSFLIEARIEKWGFGNSFISINYPFSRMLVCPECSYTKSMRATKFTWENFKPSGKCGKCKKHVKFETKDVLIRDAAKINLIRWDPAQIDIEYNIVTGERTYWYKIPPRLAKDIREGKPEAVSTAPKVFIEAVKEHKDVKFSKTNFFHYRDHILSGEQMAWAPPPLLCCLKSAWLLQLVKKNIESICIEGTIPLDIIYPSTQGNDPLQFVSMGEWKSKIESEIAEWREDKQRIPIMPVPVGWQRVLGNQGLAESVSMMQELVKIICGGVGLPQEFLYGGINYSGSSVALRVLENHFLADRRGMLGLLRFVISNVCNFLSLPVPDIRLRDFKMADDIQKRAQFDGLAQAMKISNETLLSEFGLDWKDELGQMEEEQLALALSEGRVMKVRGLAQAASQEMMGYFRAKADKKYQAEMMKDNPQMMMAPPGGQQGPVVAQMPPQDAGAQQGAPIPQEEQVPQDKIAMLVEELSKMKPEQREMYLSQLRQAYPAVAAEVAARLAGGSGMSMAQEAPPQAAPQQSAQGTDMTPLPGQLPPRRENSPV